MSEWYPPSQPIATDRGLKAKSKRGGFARNWWANRWIEALERLMDAGRLRRGRRYARKGQVLSIEERAGGVVAKVQGSRSRPYRVNIELEPLSDTQWEEVIEVLSGRAVLRRLGQPGFVDENLEHLLGPSYETVSKEALELALGEGSEEV